MTEESVIYIFFLKKWDQKSIWVYTPHTHFGAHNRGQANEIHPLYYAARVITKVIGKKGSLHCFVVYSEKLERF